MGEWELIRNHMAGVGGEGGVVWPAFLQFRCGTIVAYQSVSTYTRAGSERLERHGLSINELLSVQRLSAQPNLTQSFPTGKKKVLVLWRTDWTLGGRGVGRRANRTTLQTHVNSQLGQSVCKSLHVQLNNRSHEIKTQINIEKWHLWWWFSVQSF